MRSFTILGLATLVAAVSMAGAQAQTQTLTTTATTTVRPAGPRMGASGTNFFNVEGNGNGTNASFGVADFLPTANPRATSINNLVLTLVESDASFTAPGSFNIYLASNTGSPSNFKFDSTQLGTGGIGTQLGQLFLLGTGTFSSTGNTNTGQVDRFNLTLSSQDATNLFLSDVNNGTAIRLALGATTDTTAATFFGSTGPMATTPGAAPTLSFTTASASAPVPEASTTASFGLLLVLGLGGVAVARRRKQA
jgi:MYXO-CTERM domain-containing protein